MNAAHRTERLALARVELFQSYSPALVFALLDLERRIDEGEEFPDACYRCARKRGFMASELRDLYDAAQAL